MAFTKILPAGISTTGTVTVDSLSVGDVTLTGDTDNLIINTSTVTVRPTLDLNFARDKRLDSKITFTRNSVGTYVDANGIIQTAVNNIPRFDHDPVTLESLGLLIEESRTNLFTYSEDLSNAAWSKTRTTVSANSIIAPDGTLTADKIIENVGTSQDYILDENASSSVATYTYSFFAKAGERSHIRVSRSTGNQTTFTHYYTLENNGTATGGGNIVAYPNGWYRCYGQTEVTSAGNAGFAIRLENSSTNSIYDGDGTSGFYIWGAQYELGAFPTSYIPTSGSTVTRSKDITTIKGTNFTDVFDTNLKEFSMFVHYDNLTTDDGNIHGIIEFWGESTSYDDRIQFFKVNTSPYHIGTRAFGAGSGVFANGTLSGSSKAAVQKLATSWSVPDYSNTSSRRWAFCFSGETPIDVVADGSGTTVPTITRLGLGISPTRLDQEGGRIHFKRVVLYNKTLSDAQLQNLTK